jgi:hypothetical protein
LRETVNSDPAELTLANQQGVSGYLKENLKENKKIRHIGCAECKEKKVEWSPKLTISSGFRVPNLSLRTTLFGARPASFMVAEFCRNLLVAD